MRIMLDALLLGGRHSGVEQAIEGLVRALPQAAPQHEYVVLCRRGYEPPGAGAEEQGRLKLGPSAMVVTPPRWVRGRVGRIVYEQHFLARDWQGRCDVLHAPGYIMPLNWRGPSVLTVYDLIALQFPEYCKRSNVWHYGRALPESLRRAGRIVVPSETVAAAVRERVPEAAEKVRVAPLGIDEQFQPAEPERVADLRRMMGLPKRFILCVGNIEPKKNLAAVVRAYDLAVEMAAGGFVSGRGFQPRPEQHGGPESGLEAPPTQLLPDLVLAGKTGWDYQDVLQAVTEARHRERIHLPGYVGQADLPALYTAAELLVQWSLYEGMGLPPLEAMACGTPTLVSDGGALPEVAGPAAEVVPLGPPERLAEALVTLLTDEARLAELARRGLQHARQYTWERHATAVAALYEEVAHASR